MMDGYKVLTYDYRPPIQGGDPVWDGKRKTLNKVELDTGEKECAAGWNFCRRAHDALRIAGLWPDGYPSVLLRVRGGRDTIERGDKLRCSRLTILGVCSEDEVRKSVYVMSQLFGVHTDVMTDSQMKWRHALARPYCDESAVEAGLRAALDARGPSEWKLHQFATAREVRDRARDVRATRATRAAWAAWAARAALDARDAQAVRDAWDAWDAWEAREAREARDALTVQFAAIAGWTDHNPMLLTEGLREAYEQGLAVAVPVGKYTLGWAMVERRGGS
jgi:hypothetical protein